MKSCVFFGHRDYDYTNHKDLIIKTIEELFNKHGVTTFYCGGRGDFDYLCEKCVSKVKMLNNITFVKFLSYYPKNKDYKNNFYDETMYLLEEKVPAKFAIYYTNRKIIDMCDYIVVGIKRKYGGAYSAFKYAKSRNKTIINVLDM